MKTRPLPTSLAVALAVALVAAVVPARQALAQNQTDAKIRLMSEVLRARDARDFTGARKSLTQLETLAPNDPAVQRLRAEVEAAVAAREQAAAQPAPAPAPAPVMVEVKIPEPAPAPAAPAPAEQEAEAMARAEAQRISELVAAGQRQLATARTQLREGRPEDAIVVLDAALAGLPVNPSTQRLVADLQREKASALLDRAQTLLRRGDTAGAKVALAAHDQLSPGNPRTAGLQRQIAQAENQAAAPVKPGARAVAVDPQFAADRAATAEMIAKGRAQYVAGDLDGAQETFRSIEAREPDNTVAKGFLLRIADEKTETGALNREKTRAQMLEEVAKSWQRPGIFQERVREVDQAAAVAPLAKKLSEIVLPAVSWTRAPIGEVVAALSAISEEFDKTGTGGKGVNVVLLDPTNRNPTVTLTLRNASLKRVLDFVAESIGYQYEVQADAVVVRPGGETTTLDTVFFPVTRATVLRMTGIATGTGTTGGAARDPYAPSGGGEAPASGGEAASMKAFLTQAGVSFSVEGSSLAYDGSAIIVTQTPRNLERIRNILGRYNDVRQVEIESKFLEVQEGALEELGVTWATTRRGIPQINPTTGAPILDANGRQTFVPQEVYSNDRVTRPLNDAFASVNNLRNIAITGGTTTIATQNTTTTTSSSGLTLPVSPPSIPGGVSLASGANPLARITGVVGEFDVTAIVRALSQKQGTELLSSPKVTVLSGNPANITVAQELRYPQSYGEIQSQVGDTSISITSGTPQEFTMRNVGVELKVTPTVEEDD
jgi:general secretion pathway protein D